MRKVAYFIRTRLIFENFPYLTFLSNILLGVALGRMMATPGDELPGSIFIKALLIGAACLFWNYLSCLRRAGKGIRRGVNGKIRPFLKEAHSCAYLNASMLVLSMALFFLKVRYL